jgi:hypothetical protein
VRGVPSHPIECRRCHRRKGNPKNGVCNGCMLAPHRFYPKRVWTAEQDAELRRIYAAGPRKCELTIEIRRLITSWRLPRQVIVRRANTLGLKIMGGRSRWSAADDQFLREHHGEHQPSWLAKRLGRSYYGTICRLRALGLSGRMTEGYSADDLERCFGVTARLVSKWESLGWIKRHEGRFSHTVVRRFIREHLQEIPLKRADEPWLKGMLDASFGQRRDVKESQLRKLAVQRENEADIYLGKGMRA